MSRTGCHLKHNQECINVNLSLVRCGSAKIHTVPKCLCDRVVAIKNSAPKDMEYQMAERKSVKWG